MRVVYAEHERIHFAFEVYTNYDLGRMSLDYQKHICRIPRAITKGVEPWKTCSRCFSELHDTRKRPNLERAHGPLSSLMNLHAIFGEI